MTGQYYTCLGDDIIGGCGKIHGPSTKSTPLAKAEDCCSRRNDPARGIVCKPTGPLTRGEVDYMRAQRPLPRDTWTDEEVARFLSTRIYANHIGYGPDIRWSELAAVDLTHMAKGGEPSCEGQMWRQRVAKRLIDRGLSRGGYRTSLVNRVAAQAAAKPGPVAAKPEPVAAKPEPVAATPATPASGALAGHDWGEVAKALGMDRVAETILQAVEQGLALNEPLLQALSEKLGVARRVEHVYPQTGKVIQSGGIEHPEFGTLAKLMGGGMCNRLWITGPAGVGKTYAVEQIAKGLGQQMYAVMPVGDKYELMGYNDAHGNYQETELYRWATHDGPCTLLIDEIDGSHPNALLSINAALANGIAVFPNGQVRITDDKLVIATANTDGSGATQQHNARHKQDGALLDRFVHFVDWALHEPTEKAIAIANHHGTDDVVAASWSIRRNLRGSGIGREWGPRRTYALCRAVASGFDVKKAAMLSGLGSLEKQQVKRALDGVAL
jgi:hypothetical protein